MTRSWPCACYPTGRHRYFRGGPLRNLDFSSWQALLGTILGVALFALIGIGIRLLVMMTIQQRQQRLNRQINERLKTLIAAYKVLGGSFTGNLQRRSHPQARPASGRRSGRTSWVEATRTRLTEPAEGIRR